MTERPGVLRGHGAAEGTVLREHSSSSTACYSSVCWEGPALAQGSLSVHPAITTQLLAAFPTDSAEGIEGTALRFPMLKCPFGRKSSHFTAVQHCLNRALWQTVAPFSFLITILV